jgi:glycosyltransferase involved in cell wall biosynthesis
MKIALLTDGIYPYVMGGMQKHSFYLAKYFALNGVYVDLYHTTDAEESSDIECFSEEEKKLINSFVIKFPRLDNFPGHYIRESLQYSIAIYQLFKKNDSGITFIYAQGFCGWEFIKKKKTGVKLPPIGVHFHGLEMFQRTANIKSRLEQFLIKKEVLFNLRNADVTFSLGGKLTEILLKKGIGKEKIIETPLGIEPSWINTNIANVKTPLKFVFIGRYERRKGIEELNSVLKKLTANHSFECSFIGPVPDKKQLKLKQLTYWGSITNADEIKKIVQDCDVLICPSYAEGMPNVIVEAMASGLAVIASDVGAINQLVTKSTGILVPPGNTSQLEKAMIEMMEMPAFQLKQMKIESVKRISHQFLWNHIILETIKQIERIV